MNDFAFTIQNYKHLTLGTSAYTAQVLKLQFLYWLCSCLNVNKCAFAEINLLKYQPSSFIVIATVLLKISSHHGNFSVTPDLHLTYSKKGGNLGLVLKKKNIACISILMTKHVKYTYLYLFKFVLYSIVAFKAN